MTPPPTPGSHGRPATPSESSPAGEESLSLPLIEHLKELRFRLIRSAIAIGVGMVVGFFLVLGPPHLVDIIILSFAPTNRPYPPLQGILTLETFTSYMTVALIVGIVLGMPMIVYQLIAFISPGLKPEEKRFVFAALPFVMGFFLAGIAFGWLVTVPIAIHFLMDFGGSELIAIQPSVSDFLHTVTVLLLINGVVFELPVIIYILAWLKLVTAQQLGAYRRYAVIAVAIAAAILTPTGDPVNMLLLAVPMYGLFELGVFLARFVPERPKDR